MEIGVRSALFATEVVCYLKERILKLRIVLVWMLVLIGVLLTTAEPLSQFPAFGIQTALFIITFRLWDDLEDVDHDLVHHPERCLLRTQNLHQFQVTLWLLASISAGLLFVLTDAQRSLAYLGLYAFFFVMYQVTGKRPALRSARVALVPTKYPAFVLLFAHAPRDPMVVLAVLCVYLLPLLDEVRSTGPHILLPAAAFLGLASLAWLFLMI
ncbi:MAG: hypothetical protein PVI80_16375 [Anaerolineae bacterium]|jgi:hypothetical protein